jgi:phage shock protein A
MADEATRAGDAKKATEFTNAAEAFANRLIAVESEVESLKSRQLQATEAANQAKAAVAQNSVALQKKLSEKQRLLSQLDQAKMQEQMNAAMSSLSTTVGEDVPTLDEVREKIEARHAKAMGMSELTGASVESHMLQVEQAAMNVEAQARLSQIRSQLGLDTAPAATSATEPAAAIQAEPTPAVQADPPPTGQGA